MNCQPILLLLSMLLQGSNEPVMPYPMVGSTRGMPSDPSAQCKVGYGTDPFGKYCMIIQIPPSAIPAFAKGELGSELTADIRNDYQNYVERIIFRVGIGEVENTPPPNKLSENRSANPAFLSTLENRSTVPLDRNPETKYASAQGGFLGGNNDASVMPNNNNSNNSYDRARTSSALGTGSNGMGTNNSGTNVMPNTNSPNHRTDFDSPGVAQNNSQFREDSSARQPFSISNMIKPTQPNVPTANSPIYGQSTNNQGSTYGTGPSYGTSNPNGSIPWTATATNQVPNPNTYNPNTYNPNSHPQTNSAMQPYSTSNHPNQFGIQTPLLAQSHGTQTPQQPTYGTSGYPTIPNPSLNPNMTYAGTPITSGGSNPTGGGKANDGPNVEHNSSQESLLPFLLLFSIVGNVYLGLWMNHLRGRYRELRISTRGIPISELA